MLFLLKPSIESYCTFSLYFVKYISVGIATGYGLDDRMIGLWFPEESGNFSLHHRVQTGPEAHPDSYTVGTEGYFPGGKAAVTWSWPFTSI